MGHRRLIFWRVTLLTALATLATGAASNPQDGEVVRGSATITSTSPGRLDILQTTDKAVIDWREFSIGAAEHTHFQQPDREAVALNRVTGYQRSEIYGKLSANGRLFLINPKGILFGQSAQVDVAGLVATTSHISNDDFMSDRLHFTAPTTTSATVENQGNINITEGGLAALVAPGVTNSGIIQARLGKVLLASGNRFTLDLYGDRLVEFAVNDQVVDGQSLRVANSGEVYADGGSVLLTANTAKGILDQAINMDGYIQARSAEFDNGEIVLLGGEGGQVRVAGSLDASGREAGQTGGYIKVKGAETIISDSTRVDVSGANGGGFAELSGAQLDLDAGVNLNGGSGPGGVLTLDPVTLTVDNGAAIALVDSLNSGGTVNVTAEKTINVDAEIDSSAQTSTASLNFKDQDTDNALTINLNADIKLGANQVLSGEGTAVNVASTAQIQDGVDVAAGSATVTVAAGTYAEDIVIDKSLNLIGAGEDQTTIQGQAGGQAATVLIAADDVTVGGIGDDEGFRIEAAGLRAVHLDEDVQRAILQNNSVIAAENKIALDTQGGQHGHILRENIFTAAGSGTDLQLVYINGTASLGGSRASDTIAILNNEFQGWAQLALGNEATDSRLEGNSFTGDSSYASIELWAAPTSFSGNRFNTANPVHLRRSANAATGDVNYNSFASVIADNSFVTNVVIDGNTTASTGDPSIIYGQIQSAVDDAVAQNDIQVGAGTYAGNVTLDKQGLTLTGSGGALLSLDRNETGFNITADDVTLSGMELVGPFDSHFTQVDWDSEGNSFGVTVGPGVTGASILNNTIRNTRSGVSFFTGSEARASGNLIDNTKGSFLVRSDNISLSNNAVGANGNEWDIVFLNGVSDAAYSISPHTDQKLYGADIMALSQSNGGMRVLDRRYGSNGLLASTPQFGNRSHIEVSAGSSFTATDDFNLGNGLGNLRQPLASIDAAIDGVVDGGHVDVRAGSYVENVVIDKAVTLTGAGSSSTILAAAGGNSMLIASSIGADATVAVSGIGFDGVNGAQSGFYLAPNSVLGELIVTDTRYQNHQENGFRVIGKATGGSGLAQLTMKDAVFLNNGRVEGSQGVGDLLLYYFNGNADLSDIDISNDGSEAARYGIQMRGLEANGSFAAGGFAAMGKVTLGNVTVTGNYAASHLGIQGFDGLDNLSLNDVSLGGGNSHTGFGGSLFLSNVAEHSDTNLNLGNTDFLGSKTLSEGPDGLQTEGDDINLDMVAGVNRNGNSLYVDATAASFKNAAVSTMDNSELFSVSDRIFDAIDHSASGGLVSLRAGEVFVTDFSDHFQAGAIQRAVNLAQADNTVNVGAGNYGEKVVVDKKVALLLDAGGVNTTSLETTAGTEIGLGGMLTVAEGATLRDSVEIIADLFIDSGVGVTSLSSVNGAHTLDLTGTANLSGSYETAAFVARGDTVLRSDTVIDTSQANGVIQLLGAVDGVGSTEQNLTLNAGTGKVTSVDIGQTVRVGEVTVNSGDFDASAGTTNVDSLTVNGAEVKLGNSTVNALNGVDVKAAQITGSINANDITLEATDSVDTVVTAQTVSVQSSDIQGEFTATEAILAATDSVDTVVTAQTVSVQSTDIRGEFTATEATLAATDSVDTIVTAETVSVQSTDIRGEFTATEATLVATDSVDTIVTAQKVSVQSNDIQGEFTVTEATLVASNSIQIKADIDELDVSANTANIDGEVENIQILSGGNQFLTLNDAGFLQIPDSLGNEQSFLAPESSVEINLKELPKDFPDFSDKTAGFELSLNIVGIAPETSRATADYGNQFLTNMSLLQSDSGDLRGGGE